jgi:PAS domain S-box-containing protein
MGSSTLSRIAMGLVSLVGSVILAAMMLEIVPDGRKAILDGRSRTAEVIAATTGNSLTAKDLRRLEHVLGLIRARHPDILSAGVRRVDGQLLVEVGEHAANWIEMNDDQSVETHVQVPLYTADHKWGCVELRFSPLSPPGIWGWMTDPTVMFLAFVGSTCYIVFYAYLRRMLSILDPNQAVPGHVRSALDTLAEGLLVIDNNERIVLANRAFSKLVGIDPNKLLGRGASDFSWITETGEPQKDSWPWRDAIAAREARLEQVMRLDLGDQGKRTFHVNCSPVLGDRNSCRGVLVSLDDVTQIETQKIELARSKAEADEANRSKSSFLANMSHEIRTPMNAILGFTDVLRRGVVQADAERRKYLNTIHASGEHLLSLINDILDLSKVESGRNEVEQIECKPYEIASDVITVLQGRAAEKGLQLSFRVDSLIPDRVISDPLRLRQILTNLAGNALKFTKTGGVTIALRVDEWQNKPAIVFDVIDTGIGIPEEALEKVFQPFTQADNSVTRQFGGTGLGLTISRKFAEALGGQLTAASTVGKGSTFSVVIPSGVVPNVTLVNQQQINEALAARHHESEKPAFQCRIRSSKILIADDGEANRQLMELVLTRAGLTVVAVENGQQAIDAVARESFDLVLMDMQMPLIDGYTATARLRASGFTKPIIALTAHAMVGDEEKCRSAGCSGYLSKPVSIDALLQLLANELGEAETGGPTMVFSRTPLDADASMPTPGQPIFSSLLERDPGFREIVVGFVGKLKIQLREMRSCFQQNRMSDLVALAHWLKGSAGTLGFAPFTEPAKELERLARELKRSEIPAMLDTIESMAAAIIVPEVAGNSR